MFSFRATPLDEQQDMVLHRGRLAVLCNQAAWNPEKGEYLFDTVSRSGNLVKVFYPSEGMFGENGHCDSVRNENAGYDIFGLPDCEFIPVKQYGENFSINAGMFDGIDALLVEYQDTGSRYDRFTMLLFNLFRLIDKNRLSLSVYILDRENPCGRWVEGTVQSRETARKAGGSEKISGISGVVGIPHKHGLTLGELANLFYSELGAKFPLHIISYLVRSATQYMMPWSIPPFQDVSGLFTSEFYCGMQLLCGTDISNGEGTSRPYELFGAPFLADFIKGEIPAGVADPGVFLRKTVFTPKFGKYAGEKCFGFQLLSCPGVPYHSVAHVLRILKIIVSKYENVDLGDFKQRAGDRMMFDYVSGNIDWSCLKEHIKVEEQKWIRKAKRYMLYDEQLNRVKALV